MKLQQIPLKLVEFLLILLVMLFFAGIGRDYGSHLPLRAALAGLLFAGVFALLLFGRIRFPGSLTLGVFGIFMIFQILRAWLGFFQGNSSTLRYFEAITFWGGHLGLFLCAYGIYANRESAKRLVTTMSWAGVFVAFNILPAMLMFAEAGYPASGGGDRSFFWPGLLFHPWITAYVLSYTSHVNRVGDVIAFGFFPSFGILLYSIWTLKEKAPVFFPRQASEITSRLALIVFRFIVTMAAAASIFLLMSRGTILSFSVTALIFVLILSVKTPGKGNILLIGAILGTGLIFLAWAGNLQKAWKEVRTLEQETATAGSFTHNVEGAHRALEIYKASPVWGTGQGGYARFSRDYASDPKKTYILTEFFALNHYLQVMAEHGAGAFLYFLFLGVYGAEFFWKLLRTQSRFKIVVALSLFSPVLMVLAHAAINDVMEHLCISGMVFLAMGASLGVLRPDFEH